METCVKELGIVQSDCNLRNKCTDDNPWDLFCFSNAVKYCWNTEAWKGHQDAKIEFSSDNSTTVNADLGKKKVRYWIILPKYDDKIIY